MKLPQYVTRVKDRHGKTRYRFRRGGVDRYLPGNPGDEEFRAAFRSAKAAEPLKPRSEAGTVHDLLSQYYRSIRFNKAGPARQKVARGILEAFREEFGSDLVANFRTKDIEAIISAKAVKRQAGKRTVGGVEAARALHKQLKRLFAYAVKLEMIDASPCSEADTVAPQKGGRHTWTEEEIAQFRARHPLGSKARLALEIMLWTGQRRGDAVRFGPQHIKDGKIEFTASKGQKVMRLPAAPQLMAAIKAMPSVGIKTFLVTNYGKPFANAGFGNWFRERCNEAGLPHCTAHGLRKAIARRAAELEATQAMLKAIGGWEQDSEVTTYTKGADQARLADAAIQRISDWDKS